MSKKIFSLPGINETFYDADHQIIIARWLKFDKDQDVYDCLNAQIDFAKHSQIRVIIVDTTKTVGKLSLPVQNWLKEKAFPSLVGAGLKAVITIEPGSLLTRVSTNVYTTFGARSGLEMYQCSSMEEALEIADKIAP